MSLLKEKIELKIAETQLEARRSLLGYSPAQRKVLIFCLLAIVPTYFLTSFTAFTLTEKSLARQAVKARPSFENPLDISVTSVQITQAGAGSYAAIAAVVNENLDLSADQIPYTFHFFSQAGDELDRQSGKFFLLPGEKKYIVAPRITSQYALGSATLTVDEQPRWQKKISVPQVKLSATKPSYGNQLDPIAFYVEGSVINTSPYLLSEVSITMLLKDSQGKLLAASQRVENSLKPLERRAFKQLWPGIFSQSVAQVDVLPETNVLNASNLTLPTESKTPSSDLDRPQ